VAAFEVLAFLSAHPGVDQGLPLARGAVESATLSLQTELREVDVSTTDSSSTTSAPTPGVQRGEMRLEVVILPVSDVDRAKDFYVGLGWRLDADFTTPEGLRVVQVTPPGSQASVNFGTKVSSSEPGSVQSLILSVYDLDETRTELIARGAEVSEVFHDEGGVFLHAGTGGRVAGPDPEGRSYGSWASFSDPDGNGWLLQEIKSRLPGR
jgi:catechol 2,3-dioxygenase-like lactoylglutathione lyase family enzyme